MSEVCSPRVSDCFLNISYVRFAIKRAVKSDSGVRTTTASAMDGEIESMNPSVTATVTTPVKSCENPRTRPSENASASAVMRLTISP